MARPDFLPQDGGILFLDELNAAPAMVQASCDQLVLDRKLGEYTLPDGSAIVAAGNRDSDRAATTRMPAPLRNRFVHLDFEVDLQEWCEWEPSLSSRAMLCSLSISTWSARKHDA
jgi:MoxR-like ATPase